MKTTKTKAKPAPYKLYKVTLCGRGEAGSPIYFDHMDEACTFVSKHYRGCVHKPLETSKNLTVFVTGEDSTVVARCREYVSEV